MNGLLFSVPVLTLRARWKLANTRTITVFPGFGPLSAMVGLLASEFHFAHQNNTAQVCWFLFAEAEHLTNFEKGSCSDLNALLLRCGH